MSPNEMHGQEVVYDYPPLFDEIDAAFHVGRKPVIFSWGGRIYNPHRVDIPPALIVHEGVHGHRQGPDIEGWWRHYIDDPSFRLDEEIVAHRAEYRYLASQGSRAQRRVALKQVAGRLASPLYGRLIDKKRAKEAIVCTST